MLSTLSLLSDWSHLIPFSCYSFHVSFIIFHIKTITLCSFNCIALLACLHVCVWHFWFRSLSWPWYSLRQGIIDIQERKLCKAAKISKLYVGANVSSWLMVTKKKVTGYSRMLPILNLLCFGCFAVRQFVNGCFSLIVS